jgi:hypothetical protein
MCRCTCGTERAVIAAQIRRGRSRSCGCVRREYLDSIKYPTEEERREADRVSKRAWKKRNPEKHQAWAKRHPERMNAAVADWRRRNKHKFDENTRLWRLANRERVRTSNGNYRARHKVRVAARNRRQYAHRMAIPGWYTEHDVKACLVMQGWRCFYCLKPLLDGYHVEHMTPVSRGGSNYPDNIVCACPFCNCSKGNKTAAEFILGDWSLC